MGNIYYLVYHYLNLGCVGINNIRIDSKIKQSEFMNYHITFSGIDHIS